MINDKICKKRDELNKSIEEGKDYSIIYRISVELDELIDEFYRIPEEKSRMVSPKRGLQLVPKRMEQKGSVIFYGSKRQQKK